MTRNNIILKQKKTYLKQTSLAPRDHRKNFLSKSKNALEGRRAPNKTGSSIHES